MPGNVLVAFDGSPLSERALTYAVENFPNATITAMYVVDPIDSVIGVEAGGLPVTDDGYDDAQERATAIQTTATTLAADHDIDLEGSQRTAVSVVAGKGVQADVEDAIIHIGNRSYFETVVGDVPVDGLEPGQTDSERWMRRETRASSLPESTVVTSPCWDGSRSLTRFDRALPR